MADNRFVGGVDKRFPPPPGTDKQHPPPPGIDGRFGKPGQDARFQGSVYPATLAPLDGLPAPLAAYGFRKLLGSYAANKAVNIRRSSDNAVQDFGFDANGDFDVAGAATFIGAGAGFITTWYDQSGNGWDLTQATTTKQPTYSATAMSGRPGAVCVRASLMTLNNTALGARAQPITQSVVAARTGSFTSLGGVTGGVDNKITLTFGTTPNTCYLWSNVQTPAVAETDGVGHAFSCVFNGVSSILGVDGVDAAPANAGAAGLGPTGLCLTSDGANALDGVVAAGIFWTSVLTPAQRASLAADQMAYYNLGYVGALDGGKPPANGGAFSLRRLRGLYSGKAVNVRRSSDNATQDIGFLANGDFDVPAFNTFVGGGTGSVVTWYDQSGNSLDVTQATASKQPTISTSHALVGGRPAVVFNRANIQVLSRATTPAIAPASVMLSAVVAHTGTFGANNFFLGPNAGSDASLYFPVAANLIGAFFGTAVTSPADQTVAHAIAARPTSLTLALDGTISKPASWGAQTGTGLCLGGSLNANILDGIIAEAVVAVAGSTWADTDIAALQASQKTYYGLASGLPVAATAAYSLRRLYTSYLANKAVQVRRVSDNALQDIGFTAAGDLDVAAATTFIGASSGTIATWYDQSGNGLDVTAIAANQPALLLSGGGFAGRPSVQFAGNPQELQRSGTTLPTWTADCTGFTVNKLAAGGAMICKGGGPGSGGTTAALDFRRQASGDSVVIPNVGAGPTSTAGDAAGTLNVTGFTRTGTTIAYYHNGAANGGGAFASASTARTVLEIGCSYGVTFFGGEMPEVLMWDSALAAASLTALQANLKAYWGTP